MSPFRTAVLTISDRITAGIGEDGSGPAAAATLEAWGFEVVHRDLVADEATEISARLRAFADEARLDLVLTSGGTGLAPRDVTPEATRAVLDREVPGVAEMLRRETARFTPFAALSRGLAGIRGKTLIINLPGSPKGVREYLELLRPILPHAMKLAGGGDPSHEPDAAGGKAGK